MTTTITKRADELKPGDVFTIPSESGYLVILRVTGSPAIGRINAIAARLDTYEAECIPVTLSGEVEVEAPALTPAQQHAEECFALLCYVCSSGAARDAWHDDYLALREKIDPPQPPTLEEALAVMAEFGKLNPAAYDISDYAAIGKRMRDILDRARRAGILKA